MMPVTLAALAAGDITMDHAVVLGRLAASNRRAVREAFPEAEETLVGQAKDLLFREFETVVIAPGLLVPWLGLADVERIIYGPGKRILELSKTARFFRGPLRRAMRWRDRFCTTPGCDIPAQYCQGDHIKPRSQGGETTQDNGRHKCGHDNRWAHTHHQRHHTHGPDPPDTG